MSISINNLSFTNMVHNDSNIRKRIKSSTYAPLVKSEKSFRPKSSPIKLNIDGLESFYLTKRSETGGSKNCNNDPLTICDRSTIKSQIEPVKSYRFPSAPERRNVRSSNNVRRYRDDIDNCKLYNLGPGYVMYRNDEQFAIRIDSDEFFGPRKHVERKEATTIHFEDQKDIIIKDLEDQISNLTVYLEEEKLNHNLSLQKCQEQLELTRNILIENYTLEIENLKAEQIKLLKKTEKEYNIRMKNQSEELENKFNRTQQELNICKASFESYRQSLIKETDQKFETEKSQLLEDFKAELVMKMKSQKNDLKSNFEVDIENLKQDHFNEVDQINNKHKNEIDVLNRRFAGYIAVEEKLSETLQELEKRKREYQKLQADYDSLHRTYSSTRRELTIALNENDNLKSNIQEYSDRFEERVKRVDDDYKQRIDSLQNQIVEIRRAYMSKCEELVTERKQSDKQLLHRIENAKGVMKEIINTRQRARISLVSMDEDNDLEELVHNRRSVGSSGLGDQHSQLFSASASSMMTISRPVSAPTTDNDERLVKQQSFIMNRNIM